MFIPGIKTIRHLTEYNNYIINRSSENKQESIKDPVEIVKSLLQNGEPYHYPADHGKIYLKLIN